MSLEVKLIPPGQISQLVSNLYTYLEKSEAWTKGRANIDDIMRFLYNGQMNLWVVVVDQTKVYGYVITEVKQYPQTKKLVMQYCAGQPGKMKEVEDLMHSTLESFGKAAGCSGIEFFGRAGWRSIARKYGYISESVMYMKDWE